MNRTPKIGKKNLHAFSMIALDLDDEEKALGLAKRPMPPGILHAAMPNDA